MCHRKLAKMKVLTTVIYILISSVFLTACVNYRVGDDIDNPTVMAAKTGKDCAPMLFGLGFEPSANQAMIKRQHHEESEPSTTRTRRFSA